ncbi:MAG: hypothetical protein ABIJ11_04470 [Elusimicrobiota bacterium]
MKRCTWHLCGKTLSGRQGKFCSPNCKSKYYVAKKRKSLKQRAATYKGGCCVLCGYSKLVEALSFHHLGGKDFGIAFRGHTRSWERVRKELDGCILVCLNCHAEIHAEVHNAALQRKLEWKIG